MYPRVRSDEPRRKTVILTLTEACNLNCAYCFEHTKSAKHMDARIAKSTIAHEFSSSAAFDEIEIDLFGGEPTLRQAEIREIVEWTCAQRYEKPFIIYMDTNGTRVHGEFQDWLLAHRDMVNVGLSLDGMRETHNRNRSNSYDKIDIGFFVKNYPEQGVRMTVHDATLETLYEDIRHLHTLGFKRVSATFAHGVVWAERRDILARECLKLCEFYLEHPEVRECSLFEMHLPSVLRADRVREPWCGTGTSMVSYSVDGERYPCHTFQPNATSPGKSVTLGSLDFGSITDFSDPGCRECLIEPVCPNCYGMNYNMHGDILKRDRSRCWITEVLASAVSYLRARQIEKNPDAAGHAETYHWIAAINAIQESQSSA